MKHRSIEEIGQVAEIIPAAMPQLSRCERLERWAAILMQQPLRPLSPFSRLEYLRGDVGAAMRQDNSPLALAYADPVLRAAGLAGDRIGDGTAFFGLSTNDAHVLLCDCHYQGTMSGARVAAQVSALARRAAWGERWQNLFAFWRWRV